MNLSPTQENFISLQEKFTHTTGIVEKIARDFQGIKEIEAILASIEDAENIRNIRERRKLIVLLMEKAEEKNGLGFCTMEHYVAA